MFLILIHHQILSFLLDALPGLHYSHLQLLLVCVSFCIWFCLKQLKSCFIEFRSGDWLGHCRILNFKKFWVAFVVYQMSLLICTVKQFFSLCLNVSKSYTPAHLISPPATSVSKHIITKHHQTHSTGSHTRPFHNTGSNMFDKWCGGFGSSAVPFLCHNSNRGLFLLFMSK